MTAMILVQFCKLADVVQVLPPIAGCLKMVVVNVAANQMSGLSAVCEVPNFVAILYPKQLFVVRINKADSLLRVMTNYEAMQSMSPKQMEDILDQVYLAGLNNGMYAARQDDDSILDTNPFDLRWLKKSAEKATRFETDKEGDDYMLCALCEAIFRNAGIPVQE